MFFSETLSFQLNVMGSGSQNTATHREGSSAMGEVAHGATLDGRDSFSNGINAVSAKPSDAIISNALSHEDHPDACPSLSCRQVCPVIYTKHHFEHLKFGALQYTKDMLQRHEERQIIITRRGIARHWRKQVRREYSESHPMWTYLQKQLTGNALKRFWKARGGPQDKDVPATCLGPKPQSAIEAGDENSMDFGEPATKRMSKASARRRRRAQRQMDAREKGDTSMDIADSYPQGTAQAEEAMEQTRDRVRFQGTASHSMSDQISAELEYMLAAAPIHKERKILKARSNKAKLTSLRTLQLNRLHQSPEPPLGIPGTHLRDEDKNDQELMDLD